jgi:cyclophilin family peptidyl-prolyl cis-trans isomerase
MHSRQKRGRTSQRYAPGVELLEDRTVPAGNVQVAVIGGTLNIAGDGAAHQISVTGTGDHSAMVSSLDGTTTINGQSGPVFASGFGDTFIHLGDGNDQIVVNGIGGMGLYVNLGNGNDTFTDNGAANQGVTNIDAGAGTDTITVSNALFEQAVAIRTAGGNNQINATNIEVINFSLVARAGTDFLNTQGSTIVFPLKVGAITTAPRPTTAPSVTLSSSESSPTNANPLLFTAAFSAPVTGFSATGVQVTNGTVSSVTQVNPQTFTFQVIPQAQGDVTATVLAGAATDPFGNVSTASNTVTLTFNSIAPTVTVDPQNTVLGSPSITGTVSNPNLPVEVMVGGQTIAATVTGTKWSAQVPTKTPLADGTYSVTATATDQAGNVGTSAPATLVVSTTPTLLLDQKSQDGVPGGLRTDLTNVTLVGKTAPGATVTLTSTKAPNTPGTGPKIGQPVVAGADGSFAFTNVALAQGPNSLVVQATDVAGHVSNTFAQTFTRINPPSVTTPIADQTAMAGGAALTFNLASVFQDSEQIVRLAVAFPGGQTGNLDVNLFSSTALQTTVNNFLSYVNGTNTSGGNYTGSIFHRLAPGFVLQGGSFKFSATGTTTATKFPAIPQGSPIPGAPSVSNTLGTIAMALSGQTNSTATNGFFFSLGDNSANLDLQNGGFTAFGQLTGTGLQTLENVVNSLVPFAGNLPNGADLPGAGPFPVAPTANTTNFPANILQSDVATITTATALTNAETLSFTVVSNSAPTVVSTSFTGSTLTVTPKAAGTATIVVQAKNLDGIVTQTQFKVTVT